LAISTSTQAIQKTGATTFANISVGVGSANWGAIGGILSNQIDLQNALNTKFNLNQTTPQTIINGAPLFNVGLKTPKIYPSADSTTAIQINKADGTTNVLNVDTTNGRVGIGTTGQAQKLSVAGTFGILEGGATPTKYTIFQGGDQAIDLTYTLPTAYPTTGQVLSSTDAGVMSWVDNGVGGGADTALSNLASVAINTTLVSDTDNTDALGTTAIAWSDLFLGSGAVITFNSAPSTADVTLTHSANALAFAGGTVSFDVAPTVGAAAILYSGGALGTPLSGTVTNLTGTASININGTVGATTPTTVVGTTITANTGLMPDANDGAYIGASGTAFSDLFLASGGVINWDAGNATLTHSAGLLTSNVPLSLGTSNAFTCGSIELGHASDCTITRTGAGAIAVESVAIPTISSTSTLTNKRITKRVVTTTDDATAVIDVDTTDVYELSAVANATEFTLTGTPTDGQTLMIRIKDAGGAKGLTWTGFTAIGVTLPTTTVAGKWHYVGCVYNSAGSAWHAIAVSVQA